MYLYYLLFVGTYVITMLSTYLNKKYQTTAGTGLISTSVYMIISGVVSALPPALVLIINGQNLKVTFFSACFAFVTVISAGISTIGTFKAYEKGQFFKARFISERCKFKTGIEIHPAAKIGKGFFTFAAIISAAHSRIFLAIISSTLCKIIYSHYNDMYCYRIV